MRSGREGVAQWEHACVLCCICFAPDFLLGPARVAVGCGLASQCCSCPRCSCCSLSLPAASPSGCHSVCLHHPPPHLTSIYLVCHSACLHHPPPSTIHVFLHRCVCDCFSLAWPVSGSSSTMLSTGCSCSGTASGMRRGRFATSSQSPRCYPELLFG